MNQKLLNILWIGCVTVLYGQTSSPAGSPGSGNPPSAQTITGLLMDASCSALAKEPVRASDRTERDASTNPGTNTRALNDTQGADRRADEAVSSTATAGPSQASATGTTGAAVNTAPPPQSGNLQSVGSVQGPAARNGAHPASSGDRARANEPVKDGSVTVREKYKECVVKPGTSVFAIHTDGRVYILDDASNRMVQEQMRNEAFRASMSDRAGSARFVTVTVMGTPSADRLSITSVRK